MNKLSKNSIEIIEKIKKDTGNSPDIIIKTVPFLGTYIHVVFGETVTDRTTINEFILEFFEKKENDSKSETDVIKYLKTKIPAQKITKISKYDEFLYNIFSGFTVILVDGSDEALAIECRTKLDSGVMPAQAETIIKGPKDAFTENYQTNIGLIRKRIKSEKLWLEEHIVGKRSKTKVGILYIEDIVDKKIVKYISDKIKKIDIDSIMDSNYIIELISGNYRNVFSDYLSTERPDIVNMHLLNGKIAIIVENTQYVVIVPIVFFDFFHTSEDFYQKVINVNYTRIVRLLAFFITILTPAIYIAITTHNHEAIPEKLLISFSAQRDGVPFPSIVEALLMLITFEILKETDLRIPNMLGSALSIVGALVLGEAAVQAGIVSPIMVIVIAITAISGLIVSSVELSNGIRWWRIIYIIGAASLGLIGVLLVSLVLVINITSIKSFGLPFFSPVAPLNFSNQNNAIFLTNKRKFMQRDSLTAKRNKKRSAGSDENA
jgi:spore germination protein KA